MTTARKDTSEALRWLYQSTKKSCESLAMISFIIYHINLSIISGYKNALLLLLFTFYTSKSFSPKMENKAPYQHQEWEQSCFKDAKKRNKVTWQLQPIEYFYLIPPGKEIESRSSDSEDDYKQIFFIKGKKKILKEVEND